MNRTEFWELIDRTRLDSGEDSDKQAELLVAELSKLSEQEILDYQEILDDLEDEAYIAELWDVAHIIAWGCSDDDFMDFRAWLIGQGRDIFENALVNPESLVDLVEVGQKITSEDLLYVAMQAYELRTGKGIETMPRPKRFNRPDPQLKGISSKDEDSRLKRFPKAAAKFWVWWQNNKDKWFLS
jgi:hypothetical protein